jgi:hypothetical protein
VLGAQWKESKPYDSLLAKPHGKKKTLETTIMRSQYNNCDLTPRHKGEVRQGVKLQEFCVLENTFVPTL